MVQGPSLYDLKPDRCVAFDQIDSYLEPDGRSGITSPSDSMAAMTLDLLYYWFILSIAATNDFN
jgi:hypothetical protein